MAIPRFDEDLAIISKLGDNPGSDNNLTTDAFRAKFDEGPQKIQQYLNEVLIPAAEQSSSPQEGLNMEGGINMNGQPLTGLKEPEADTDAATKSYVQRYADTKQPQHINKVITLSASGWSDKKQSVYVSGFGKDDTVISTPSADSRELYTECGVKLYSQAQNSLTFVCEEVPGEALAIHVSCFPLGGSGTAGGGGSSGGGVDYVIPEFDLAAMGLPAIPMDGSFVMADVDTTALLEAFDKGLVKVRFAVGDEDNGIEYFTEVTTGMNMAGDWIVSRTLTPVDVSYSYTIWVSDHVIYAKILALQTALDQWNGGSY
jgi:hypothetical protein